MTRLLRLAATSARTAGHVVLSLLLLPFLISGCAVAGVLANAGPGQTVKPSYTGLKGQSVGVMVWADRGTRTEHDALLLDVSQGVTRKLQGSQTNKASEVAGTTFPHDKGPEAIYAFQQNHPGLEAEPIATVAPQIGVSRLIYIELEDFELHPEKVVELDRGTMTATVQVVEVTGGKGKIAFTDSVRAIFPDKSPEEGLPGLGERKTYRGTVDAFTTAVVQKFVSYEEPK